MKIKMVDIARHLGVSKATVSLAVNGKPGVNEETRRMVLECLEEMKKNNDFCNLDDFYWWGKPGMISWDESLKLYVEP